MGTVNIQALWVFDQRRRMQIETTLDLLQLPLGIAEMPTRLTGRVNLTTFEERSLAGKSKDTIFVLPLTQVQYRVTVLDSHTLRFEAEKS